MHALYLAFAIVAAVSQMSVVVARIWQDRTGDGCLATFIEGISAVALVWLTLLLFQLWL